MDKKTAGLVSAISALTPFAATAAPAAKTLAEVMAPASYAELLQPIPNAAELLKEAAASAPEPEARVEQAQYYGNPYYYPNYNYYYAPRPRYYHHHHHHHHNYGGWGGWGGGWGGGPYYHHHHHHHHSYYWRPY